MNLNRTLLLLLLSLCSSRRSCGRQPIKSSTGLVKEVSMRATELHTKFEWFIVISGQARTSSSLLPRRPLSRSRLVHSETLIGGCCYLSEWIVIYICIHLARRRRRCCCFFLPSLSLLHSLFVSWVLALCRARC